MRGSVQCAFDMVEPHCWTRALASVTIFSTRASRPKLHIGNSNDLTHALPRFHDQGAISINARIFTRSSRLTEPPRLLSTSYTLRHHRRMLDCVFHRCRVHRPTQEGDLVCRSLLLVARC